MKNFPFFLLYFLLSTQLVAAQTTTSSPEKNPEKSIILAPSQPSNTTSNQATDSTIKNPSALVSSDKIKDTIDGVLMNNKTTSLMFDDEENSNINRAIDSLRSNQPFAPDDAFDSKALSEEEKKRNAQKAEEEERKKLENEKSYAHLASILYLNEKNWVIWINQRKLLSSANKKENELYVKSIDKDSVRCIWRMSLSKWKILSGKFSAESAPKVNSNNQVEMEFTLKPNQAYSLVKSKIVEGKSNIGDLAIASNQTNSQKDTENKNKSSAEAAKVFGFTNSNTSNTTSANPQNSPPAAQ